MSKKTKTLTLDFEFGEGNERASGKPALTEAQVREDFVLELEEGRKFSADGKGLHAIHYTEIVPSHKKILKPLAKKYGYKMFSVGMETILHRADIPYGARAFRLLSKGKAYVMLPGYLVKVRMLPLGRKFPITVGGAHVAPAWRRKGPNSMQGKLAAQQFRLLRLEAAAKLRSQVMFIFGMDGNDQQFIPLVKDRSRQKLLAPIHGYEHQYGITPPTWTAKPGDYKILPNSALHTDHPFTMSRTRLTREVSA